MNKIDRLIMKARPKPSLSDRLKIDNPYMGKTFEELILYLSADNYIAPEMQTFQWSQFVFALMSAPSDGRYNTMEILGCETAQDTSAEQEPDIEEEIDPMSAFKRLYDRKERDNGTDQT